MGDYTKGEFIKRTIADELVASDTHFETDQLVAVLDILDKVGVPDMYGALKKLHKVFFDDLKTAYSPEQNEALTEAFEALAKAEGKS